VTPGLKIRPTKTGGWRLAPETGAGGWRWRPTPEA